MKLINKFLIINILLFIAAWGSSCDDGDLEKISTPEVSVKLTAIKIDIESNNIPQCLEKVYKIEGTFNDDSKRLLTEKEIDDYITWSIESSVDASPVPFSKTPRVEWSCDNGIDSSPDVSSDSEYDPDKDIRWWRISNRIRFDSQGIATIVVRYEDDGLGIGPFYTGRDLTIDVPKLKRDGSGVQVIAAPMEMQLRGNSKVADGVTFSEDGVCERVVYEEYKLVLGCVKQFLAIGFYDSDETRDISQHEDIRWSIDPTSDLISDNTADYPAGFLNHGPMDLVSPVGREYPDKEDWSYKCRDATVDASVDNVTEYWKKHGCNYPVLPEWRNRHQYKTTFDYLSGHNHLNEPTNDIAHSLLHRKGSAFGLNYGLSFQAKAEMTSDGVFGYSPNIDVIPNTISFTKIFKPPKHVSSDNADFIEELRVQLKAVGVYNNDTSMDITEEVTWSTLQNSYFTVNYLAKGAIYGNKFPRNGPDVEKTGVIKARISGSKEVELDLSVERKRLYYTEIVIDPDRISSVLKDPELIGGEYVVPFGFNETDIPAEFWAVFNNFDGTREHQSSSYIGKVDVSKDPSTDWYSELATIIRVNNGINIDTGEDSTEDKGKVTSKTKGGVTYIVANYNYRSDSLQSAEATQDKAKVSVSSQERYLKNIQVIPSSIRTAEGEAVRLRAWGIYSNKVVEELVSEEQVFWESTSDKLRVSSDATTSILIPTRDVAGSVTAYVKAFIENVGKDNDTTASSVADITIDDVQLKSIEVSLNQNWLNDISFDAGSNISGDSVEMNVLGSFIGFIDDTSDSKYVNCDKLSNDIDDGGVYICSRYLVDSEVDVTYDNTYIEHSYDPVRNIFIVTPKDVVNDVTVDISVSVNIPNLQSPIGSDGQKGIIDFRKKISLDIYDIPTVEFQDATSSLEEGADAVIPVKLSHAANQDIYVSFEFRDGSPHPASGDGVDYDSSISKNIVIPAGEVSANISFGTSQDDRNEYSEKVALGIVKAELVNVGKLVRLSTGVNSSHELTIEDNDKSLVSFDSELRRWVNEVDSSHDLIRLHVKLSAVSDRDATVHYAFNDGGTANEYDYQDMSGGEVRFAPGETGVYFDVKIENDSTHEIDETLIVDLSSDSSWGDNFGLAADATSVIITIIDNDSLNIRVATGDATNITNTGNYSLKPVIEATQDGVIYSISNVPDWATFDINTGVLESVSAGRPSKDEVRIHPSSSKVVICVQDTKDATGAEVDCMSPFQINVRTCESSGDGSIFNSSVFNRGRFPAGDKDCGKPNNHVTVINSAIDWSDDHSVDSFVGIIEVKSGGTLRLGNVSGSVEKIKMYGGVLEVTSDSTLNGSLELLGSAEIRVNSGVTLTYNGDAVNIGNNTLDIAGGGVLNPVNGLILDSSSGGLRLGGVEVKKVLAKSVGADINMIADSTIDVLSIESNKVLKISGDKRLHTNASVASGGKLEAAHNGRLSGSVFGSGEFDVSGDALTLGGDMSIDVGVLTTDFDTTLDTSGNSLEWDGRNRSYTFKGKIVVNGGVFRLIDSSADINATIELNSNGRLEAKQSATVAGSLSFSGDSAIDVSADKTLTYNGNAINISKNTLSLEGTGNIERGDSSDLFTIEAPSGRLKINDNLRMLDSIKLSGGTLEINHSSYDISHDLHLVDATASTILINSGNTLNYTPAVSLDIGVNSLILDGSGTLKNDKNFNLTGNGVLRVKGGGIIDKVRAGSSSARIIAEEPYTIKTLSVASGVTAEIQLEDQGDLTIDDNLNLGSNRTFSIASGSSVGKKVYFKNGLSLSGGTLDVNQSLEVSGDINVNADSVFDVSSGKTLTHRGASFNIVKILSLNGGGEVTGDFPMVIGSGGTLKVDDVSSIGGPIQLSGGKLQLNQSTAISGDITQTLDSTIDISSGLVLTYSGADFNLDKTLYLTGGCAINNSNSIVLKQNGVLRIDGVNYEIQGPVVLSGGELKVNQSALISGAITQDSNSAIEVPAGQVLTYTNGAAINLSGVTLTLKGGGSVSGDSQVFASMNSGGTLKLEGENFNILSSADLHLNGGKLHVAANSDVSGDITQASDSTIDVDGGKTFVYRGASLPLGTNTLYLAGSGTIANINAITLVGVNSRLLFKGGVAPSVKRVAMNISDSSIKVEGDATIDFLTMSHNFGVDIAAGKSLRVNNNFSIPGGAILNASGSGALRFNSLSIDGSLQPSGAGSLYADILVNSGGALMASGKFSRNRVD